MKDAIKAIVIDELKKHGITDTGVLSAIGSTIATRLDKAIGIDREKVKSILHKNSTDDTGCGGTQVGIAVEDFDDFVQAIAQSRPLKCEA